MAELFGKFPGIGPRQAKRFVYFLLSRNNGYTSELIGAIQNIKKEIIQCEECMRFYAKNGHAGKLCAICSDDSRDSSMLMVVPRDIDLDVVEKSGSYNGYYFVLGGVVPILEKEPEKKIRIKDLGFRIQERMKNGLKEIILAMNANIEGENTADYIKQRCQGAPLTFSTLGRGLSTGAELEYADPETLKSAFQNRH